jgi:hypothetical protein
MWDNFGKWERREGERGSGIISGTGNKAKMGWRKWDLQVRNNIIREEGGMGYGNSGEG